MAALFYIIGTTGSRAVCRLIMRKTLHS